MSGTTPAGWYPSPERPDTQRYWDGAQWTGYIAPRGPSAPAASGGANDQAMAVLALVFAVLVPFVGFILGVICAARGRESIKGTVAIILSVFAAVGWYTLLANQAASGG